MTRRIWFLIQVCLMVMLTMQTTTAEAQALATTFQLPLKNYQTNDGCFGWGYKNADFGGKLHVADDVCASAGTEVYAVANGVIRFAGKYKSCPTNWGTLIIVEHTLPDGEMICSIYGHTTPSGVKAGDSITKGQLIGYVMDDAGCWVDHLHFSIYKGPYSEITCSYDESTSKGSCYAQGYLAPSAFPGKYTDPAKFVNNQKPYFYDNNAISCGGPVVGGTNTDWYYTCYDERTYFNAGEPVTGFIRINDVWINHSFKVEAYKNGNYQWEWSPGWNQVDPNWGWKYSHFWPTLWDSTPGNWQFKFYLDTGAGYKYLDEVSFSVIAPEKGYVYDYNVYTCHGPVTGGWWTNWFYTCENPSKVYKPSEPVAGLIRINDVWVNHSFKVETYKDGTYQWEWSPGWNSVDPNWGWNYSHFWPTLWNSTPGNWQFKFYLDTGAGYKVLDSTSFLVK